MERNRRFVLFRIPTRAVRLSKTVMPRKDARRARRAVSARLRWFVARLMRLFKTAPAELLERAQAKADAVQSPEPPDRAGNP
jgi:hypothetical protein